MKKLSFLLALLMLLAAASDGTAQTFSTPKQDKEELKILSWNIYMLPRFAKHTGKRKRARKIAEVLAKEDYDIFVFQEAFHGDARRILKRAFKKTYPYRIGPANRNPFWVKTSSGVWMVSKIPLTELEAIKYDQCTGVDCWAKKGALLVEATWQNTTFQLLGTHIQAAGPDSIKHSQYEQVRELIDKHKKEGVPQILAGDFNMGKDRDEYYPMLKALDVPEYEPDSERKFTAADDNDIRTGKGRKSKTGRLIDFVFYRANGKQPEKLERNIMKFTERWSEDNEDLSDHYAVEAVIKF